MNQTEKQDEYVITFYDGTTRCLRVPENSRVTFGPITPKPIGRNQSGNGRPDWDRPPEFSAWCLRVYGDKSKKDLIACYPNVHSFRKRGVTLMTKEQEGGPIEWTEWDEWDLETTAKAVKHPDDQPF